VTAAPSQLLGLAHAHAAAEASGDLEATLATLEPVPVYTFWPAGVGFTGMAATRRYYEHYFSYVASRIAGYTMHGEFESDAGLAQEYTVVVRHDDGRTREHRILGILTFGRTALSGERLYASEEFFRFLVGPLWNELRPL
jgi:hypothetical protein